MLGEHDVVQMRHRSWQELAERRGKLVHEELIAKGSIYLEVTGLTEIQSKSWKRRTAIGRQSKGLLLRPGGGSCVPGSVANAYINILYLRGACGKQAMCCRNHVSTDF